MHFRSWTLYKDVLPDSFCADSLVNTRMADRPEKMRKTNKRLMLFMKILMFYSDHTQEDLLGKFKYFLHLYLSEYYF